jgi:aspartate aminotransferase
MKSTSAIVDSLPESATIALTDKARTLKALGHKVVSFTAGEPDFDTPVHIKEAANRSLQAGNTHYVSSRGIPKLLDAIASKLKQDNGITVDPSTDIIVTPGSKVALYITLATLCNPGDEVLILEPGWVSYDALVRLPGAVPVPVALDWQRNWVIEETQLESLITPRTKAIIVNSPNNPTGRVMSDPELAAIDHVATRHNLYIVSDEVYDRIIYDVHPTSPASLPHLAERTLTVNGFSKTFAMTGWRLGYVAGNRDLISKILNVQQHVVTCATSFVQEAGIAAINGPQEPVEDMIRAYRSRRDVILSALQQMPGVHCNTPEGAFYAFPRFPAFPSSDALAEILLDKCQIATIPGAAFGKTGEQHLRLSYACSMDSIASGMERLDKFLRS